MKKMMLAVLALVVASVVQAADAPKFTLRLHRVNEAYVDRMVDPPDAYAFQLKGPDGWTQCELTQNHTTIVEVRTDLDGTYTDAACPRQHECFCYIFVPNPAMAANYQMLMMRFKQAAPPMSDARIQYRIQ